jgi:hypothetical protein
MSTVEIITPLLQPPPRAEVETQVVVGTFAESIVVNQKFAKKFKLL